MAIGGWLKPDLQKAAGFLNPPDGNRGMVKVQPPVSESSQTSMQERLDFNHPPIAIGGILGKLRPVA